MSWRKFTFWGVMIVILNGLHAVLGLLGDADFIIERIHNPSWIGAFWNLIITPTPKINSLIFLFLVIGFIVFYVKTHISKPLRITFSPSGNSSFYQEQSIEIANDVVYYELYRVCVKSKSIMPEVRISLESLQPCPFHLSGKFPLALHLQHDATDSQKIFKLGKNDEKYVDIIQRRFSMNTKSWRLVICHIETGIETDIPDEQNYELTIKVRSDEDEDTKKFSAGVEPDKSRERLYGKGLFMREIS